MPPFKEVALAVTMYGIRNCDTIAKARAWLEQRGVNYSFHDYKTAGLDRDRLELWVMELGWEVLLNKAGVTFRKLDPADRENIDEEKAIMLMLQQPSMIKRPLLDVDGKLIVGFKSSAYEDAVG